VAIASTPAVFLQIPLSAFGHRAGARKRMIEKMQGVPDPSARTILLLDDDPDVGIAAQLLLQRRVGPVHCLRRPSELIAALERLRPALLLLDLNFGPGRSDGAQGLRLLDEILVATCQEALQRAHPAPEDPTTALPATPVQSLAAQERAAVMAAMAEAEGNLSAAARALGLSRAALYRRLEKYGL
jgi:two-component system response regulator RegA